MAWTQWGRLDYSGPSEPVGLPECFYEPREAAANDLDKATIAGFPASTTSWTVVATITNGNWGGGGPSLTVQG